MAPHVLQLFTVAGFAIAVPQLARASDAGTGRAIKLAMGPMSAPLKNQGMQTAAADPPPSMGQRPHHRSKCKPC